MSKRSIFFFFGILPVLVMAQEKEPAGNRLTPSEFSIPPSPVFDLMGVTPSQINRTSDLKNFKVDWSFKSWRLNPNLALQSQPFWEIFFNRKDLSRYQQASPFMRKLASLDLSLGTVQNEENDRRIGGAVKLNLLKQKDPLLARELYEDIGFRFSEEKKSLEVKLQELKGKLDTLQNILEKPALRAEITATEEQLLSLNSRRNTEINERAKIFIAENWNAASLDIAAGRVYTYQSDSAGSLKKLRLNRNTGWGIWINGGFPIGKRWMLSGLLRTTWYEEELDFLLRNTVTQEENLRSAVAENKLYSAGMNLRYGGPLYSFFVEFLYEKKALKTPVEALRDAFTEPAQTEIVASSVKWTVVHPNSLSIGGDWRISRNVIINYGMRWIIDKDGRSRAFIPVAGISCMMR
ncbi:MAG: hypothetical protein IAE96_04180 [Chitinophagaceae bacterium]|nr:hypothetical protein [Chitinophagaceae bacterium]